ncbi:MAG: hypothetical protein ACM3NQ_03280 [Bacteroidales bacterium]
MDTDEHRGWRRRAVARFTAMVDSVDAARHGAAERRRQRQPRTVAGRVKDRVICWLAEKIAEQRLLWHLRRQTQVTAWHPDDVSAAAAEAEVRGILREDARRHGRWVVVHAVAAGLSLLLMPIPGPNLLGYYFTFRFVGHYLSRGGAVNGLDRVEWHFQPTTALTELRRAMTLEHASRHRSIADIASRLRLEHLAAFVERLSPAQ